MGTEVAISFSALRAQLENEKSSLCKIDENIKKIVQTTGRFNNDRFAPSGEYARGGNRVGGRPPYPDAANNFTKNEEQYAKRKETKTVFSRLSARANDSDGDDEGPGIKRARVPSAVCRELPTRAAVLRAQGDDEQARTRNRRIFGSLLGTLQKFKQEEIVLQTKEDKKAQVERKIEEQARQEKEREQKERKTLFAEREHKKATIKALEAKMGRVQEFEKWELSQKHLSNFILTKGKPHIYWLPKKMNDKSTEKLLASRKFHEKYMIKKRQELQEELVRIEHRCLRLRVPGAKENHPQQNDKLMEGQEDDSQDIDMKDGEKRKRNKFAADADLQDDSDGDAHDEEHNKVEEDGTVKEENVTDPSTEQKETMEVDDPIDITQENVETISDNKSDENDVVKVEEQQHSQ